MSHTQMTHTLSPLDIDEYWIAYTVCPWGEGGETIRFARLAYVIASVMSSGDDNQKLSEAIKGVFYPKDRDDSNDEALMKARLLSSMNIVRKQCQVKYTR